MEIIAILVIAYALLKNKNEDAANTTSDETVVISGTAGTVVVDPKTGNTVIHASISVSKAKSISAALVAHFSQYFADEAKTIEILYACKNDADYRLVYKEFGTQKRHFLFNYISNFTDDGGDSDDMTQWIMKEVQEPRFRAKLKSRFPATF